MHLFLAGRTSVAMMAHNDHFGNLAGLEVAFVVKVAFGDRIMDGSKTLEVSGGPMRKYVNKPVGLAISGTRQVVGEVVFGESFEITRVQYMSPDFRARHQVQEGQLENYMYDRIFVSPISQVIKYPVPIDMTSNQGAVRWRNLARDKGFGEARDKLLRPGVAAPRHEPLGVPVVERPCTESQLSDTGHSDSIVKHKPAAAVPSLSVVHILKRPASALLMESAGPAAARRRERVSAPTGDKQVLPGDFARQVQRMVASGAPREDIDAQLKRMGAKHNMRWKLLRTLPLTGRAKPTLWAEVQRLRADGFDDGQIRTALRGQWSRARLSQVMARHGAECRSPSVECRSPNAEGRSPSAQRLCPSVERRAPSPDHIEQTRRCPSQDAGRPMPMVTVDVGEVDYCQALRDRHAAFQRAVAPWRDEARCAPNHQAGVNSPPG